MSRNWYRREIKKGKPVIQGILVAVLFFGLLNLAYWTEGSLDVSEVGRSFEETSLFLGTAEKLVRNKIEYQQNKELFEQSGQYLETKEIDIRQYMTGSADEANLNLNTTYYIGDLLKFYQNGAGALEQKLHLLEQSGKNEQEIEEALYADSGNLETILPISGSSLADYARIGAPSAHSLTEYYMLLCDVSGDIYHRYQEYMLDEQEQNSSDNADAPSNIKYYVENTNTKQKYTNLGTKSLTAARRMIQNSRDMEFLFEGERSMNIMVANSEYVMNDKAGQWFINTRFLGSGEKVLIAVNTDYLVGDPLQTVYHSFEKREPIVYGSLAAVIISAVVLLILFSVSIRFSGRKNENGVVELTGFDMIPTEIAAGLCLIAAIIWYFAAEMIVKSSLLPRRILLSAAAMIEYWIFLWSLLSFVRRFKAETLWNNSVCYAVLLGCGQVYNAKKSSKQLMIAYPLFFALNIFFLRFFGMTGIFMALVMDMAVLLYLMRDVVGKQSVREGLYQISQGHLDYKIDTTALTGESLEMADAVNEMGTGLKNAVDSMIRNERLKAELITNVSHDIKTPLTSIINYVDLLKRENLENERAQEYICVLEKKSQRLRQLTEDLIEASKISSGNIEIQRMDLALGQMLRQAYGEFVEKLEEHQLQISLDVPNERILISADGRQLWRIFENLLGNIAKYAAEGSTVYLKLYHSEDTVHVIFKNQCAQRLEVGAQDLQERFVRGDLSRNTEGSGLGLSIAKSLTELMDGTFQISLEDDWFIAELTFPVRQIS